MTENIKRTTKDVDIEWEKKGLMCAISVLFDSIFFGRALLSSTD